MFPPELVAPTGVVTTSGASSWRSETRSTPSNSRISMFPAALGATTEIVKRPGPLERAWTSDPLTQFAVRRYRYLIDPLSATLSCQQPGHSESDLSSRTIRGRQRSSSQLELRSRTTGSSLCTAPVSARRLIVVHALVLGPRRAQRIEEDALSWRRSVIENRCPALWAKRIGIGEVVESQEFRERAPRPMPGNWRRNHRRGRRWGWSDALGVWNNDVLDACRCGVREIVEREKRDSMRIPVPSWQGSRQQEPPCLVSEQVKQCALAPTNGPEVEHPFRAVQRATDTPDSRARSYLVLSDREEGPPALRQPLCIESSHRTVTQGNSARHSCTLGRIVRARVLRPWWAE
jgi:hypothetical protein